METKVKLERERRSTTKGEEGKQRKERRGVGSVMGLQEEGRG